MSSLEELELLADRLLKQAQALPPGADRNEALKDIGKLRQRLDALKSRATASVIAQRPAHTLREMGSRTTRRF